MKTLASHINEALKIGKDISKFSYYSYRPTNRDELLEIIYERIKQEGPNCDLNDIDTSLITDMSWLFNGSIFNGNISEWDTSNVTNMKKMFAFSHFNGDISNWDVSKVTNMMKMFIFSKFNQDISNWNINDKCDTDDMFGRCDIKEEYKPKSLQK